jgi:metacaspase-1
MSRKKSLLIGINYTGSENELHGCHQDVENIAEFLRYQGYPDDPRSQVILRDDREGSYNPTGHNILVNLTFTSAGLTFADRTQAAIDWLVSEPGTTNFLQ